MSEDVFGRYSSHYDLLYRDKDYVAEADYVQRTLGAIAPHARQLLELGSGTGRLGYLLAERGFDVFGLERSQSMIAKAKSNTATPRRSGSGTFDCEQGDIRTTTLARKFDAVISLFHVVSYQCTNDDLLQTFGNAGRHLGSGGVFFFDVWHGPAVLSQRPSTRIKRVENAETRLVRTAEPEVDYQASVVTVRYTIFAESKPSGKMEHIGEEHRMRYLFPTEIEFLASRTGFSVERTEEFLSGNAPSDKTWGVAYILRKLG